MINIEWLSRDVKTSVIEIVIFEGHIVVSFLSNVRDWTDNFESIRNKRMDEHEIIEYAYFVD
jgi:hypothetical protein